MHSEDAIAFVEKILAQERLTKIPSTGVAAVVGGAIVHGNRQRIWL